MANEHRPWIEQYAPVLALVFTIIVLVFSAGVAWSTSQARTYVDQKISESNKDTNEKYDRILLELGRLQGKDEARKK